MPTMQKDTNVADCGCDVNIVHLYAYVHTLNVLYKENSNEHWRHDKRDKSCDRHLDSDVGIK